MPLGDSDRQLRGFDVVDVDHLAFYFGDDFLGHDHHIAVFDWGALSPGGVHHQTGQVVADLNLRHTLNPDNPDFRRHGLLPR